MDSEEEDAVYFYLFLFKKTQPNPKPVIANAVADVQPHLEAWPWLRLLFCV